MTSIYQLLLNKLKSMRLISRKQTLIIESKEAEWIEKQEKMSYYCDLKTELHPVEVHKKSCIYSTTRTFTVYIHSYMSTEAVEGEKKVVFGIGIVIENGKGKSVSKSGKGLVESSTEVVQIKNLIEGLKAACSLGLKRINVVSQDATAFRLVTGIEDSSEQSLAGLIKEATLLVSKFRYCHAYVIEKDHTSKDAVTLARTAMGVKWNEVIKTCKICLTDMYVEKMVSAEGCRHLFCEVCMIKYVEVKVFQGIGFIKCPHDQCTSFLKLGSCRKFLSHEVFYLLNERVKEATIPVSQKVYCPYPRCSALMSKSSFGGVVNGASRCTRCGGLFCMGCQVAWHSSMSCSSYKQSNPPQLVEDARVKAIAERNSWRQCPMCNHMVSLWSGCYHITCICGHHFCYNCGADYKNRRPTCTCSRN